MSTLSKVNVVLKSKKVIEIEIDIDNSTVNDLISKIKSKQDNITIKLITIGGEDVKSEMYSEKLSKWDLCDGENILLSDTYNGGE